MDRRRSARQALLLLLCGLPGLGLLGLAWAESQPPPVGPGVRLGAPEPPLADAAPPRPPAEAADLSPPLVTIRVRVAANAVAGQELEYRILVENRARAPAHHVLVRAGSPAKGDLNADFVRASPEPLPRKPDEEFRWEFGTLAGGASKEIVLVVKPTGGGDVQCCARVAYEHGQCVRTRLAGPEVRLKRSGPGGAALNDILTYRIEATNAGPSRADDVVVQEELPPGLEFLESDVSTPGDNPLTWKLGALEPGRSRKIEYKVIAKDLGSKTLRGKLLVGGKTADESSVAVLVEQAKLVLEVSGPARRLVGRPTTYQITIANTGSLPATGVRVLSQVPDEPAGVAFVSADQGGKLVGNRVEWALGTLRPGERRALQLVLKATKAGNLESVVKAEGERGVRAAAETKTEFEAGSGLGMEIDRGAAALEVGKKAVCTVKVVNLGSADATRLALSFTAPEGLKVVGAKGPAAEPRQDGQTVQFAVLEKLAAGAEAAFTVEVEAVKKGPARLRAELTADQTTSGPLRAEEALTVIEEETPAGPAPAREGT
jgi:uncharacterized repeat protein (TIGR01451 family)